MITEEVKEKKPKAVKKPKVEKKVKETQEETQPELEGQEMKFIEPEKPKKRLVNRNGEMVSKTFSNLMFKHKCDTPVEYRKVRNTNKKK